MIYWRDVKKSGAVFGTGLVVLLAISFFSVISVVAYLSLLILVGTVSFRVYKTVLQAVQKTSDGHPFKYVLHNYEIRNSFTLNNIYKQCLHIPILMNLFFFFYRDYLEFELTLPQEKVQQVATVSVAHVNAFLAELRRLFLVEDLVDSIKFGVLLWALTYLGSWFNGITLVVLGKNITLISIKNYKCKKKNTYRMLNISIYLAYIALFTLPKVYENNKQSIDVYLDLVRSKLLEVTDK